jgi:rRNA-processing protein FCF1
MRTCGRSRSSLLSYRGKFPLLFPANQRYYFAVSASEIIEELPKLSDAERRAIRESLLEIANQDADVAVCNQTALDGALVLDQMEDEDARRQSR